ncbi:MAG: sulfatase-like hydrolase/transferase [Cyclobacteriaceae bacterium]|nr:sulfatase-like hydrolase/transferase [Cyclobacteriaceae bacterium]
MKDTLSIEKYTNTINWISVLTFCYLLIACQPKIELPEYSNLKIADRPNILWLVTEDMGPYLAAFGDSTAHTPNLDRLASEGVVYPNLYSTSGVCAPSRAAIATGMYPSSIGANHMRTTSNMEITGLPSYEAIPPPQTRMLSELLRMNGYYCSNNNKQDYQFKAPLSAWDESNPYAHWRNRGENQPFFSVFNLEVTHESRLFEPYGIHKYDLRHYHSGDTSIAIRGKKMDEEEIPIHVAKDTDFPIPPYLPDNEVVRHDLWKMYNNIAEMDRQLGAILKQLETDGLLESTIIFFYSDHGGPLPRQKRLINDSGLNSPMIIRFPNKQFGGMKDDQLISFVDFSPTLLSLIGMKPPQHLQGQAFLGKYQSSEERKFIHAAADRFDGFTDAIRAVRDKRFKYIRNYRPEQGYYLPVVYRERIPTMQELLRLRDEGKLNEYQAQWFREKKEKEELYDCLNDPHELNNLAADPANAQKIEELRKEMDRWINAIGDYPNLPERELIDKLWKGNDQQPVTDDPEFTVTNGKVIISCSTQGASVAYKIIDSDKKEASSWSIYSDPIVISPGSSIKTVTHRIGFKPSQIVTYSIPENKVI